MMTFSEFVITVRKKLKLSQKQLASAINVSFSTINRWENDHVIPSNLAVKSFYDFCENNFIEIPDDLLWHKYKLFFMTGGNKNGKSRFAMRINKIWIE